MFRVFAAILFFSMFPKILETAVSCKDQNNNDVDWFVSYKMPILTDDVQPPGVRQGCAFYYIDVNMDSFVPSKNDMTSNQQAIAYTLKQYYDNKSSLNSTFVLYNDQKPNSTFDEILESVQYGHLKGVVYFEKSGGFWLIHSIPKFPSKDAYVFPQNGKKNGQSILCISLNYDKLNNIGIQLFYNHPIIYQSQLAPSMRLDNPDLEKVINGYYKNNTPYSSTLRLLSNKGQEFLSFAKTANFPLDLYDGLVAPTLQTPLFVETWRAGNKSLFTPLDCTTKYRVLDALTMKVQQNTAFNYTKDHSKIAVSSDSGKPYVCIGDINRMVSQNKRGGGAICTLSPKLWQNYKPMFLSTNQC